jgi:hypothetical protein
VAHTPCSPRPFGPAGPSRARALPPPPSSLCPSGPACQCGHFPRVCARSLALSARGPLCQFPRPRVTAARAARAEVSAPTARVKLATTPPSAT